MISTAIHNKVSKKISKVISIFDKEEDKFLRKYA